MCRANKIIFRGRFNTRRVRDRVVRIVKLTRVGFSPEFACNAAGKTLPAHTRRATDEWIECSALLAYLWQNPTRTRQSARNSYIHETGDAHININVSVCLCFWRLVRYMPDRITSRRVAPFSRSLVRRGFASDIIVFDVVVAVVNLSGILKGDTRDQVPSTSNRLVFQTR